MFKKFIGKLLGRNGVGMGGGVVKIHTQLTARKKALDENGVYQYTGDDRVVKDRVVTTAYVTFLAAQHVTDSTVIGDFKYHDSGIGVGAEAAADTALGTAWGGARSVGNQSSAAGVYTSVATTTYNATKAITEHGLFSAASGVTLMDRTVFAAINVVDTNQIEWTFTITFSAGG